MQQLIQRDGEKKITRGFSITPQQMADIREAALEARVSDSHIIRDAIDLYFKLQGLKASS
jgi:hypothetical protein